jgi:hypothetical protein
VELHVNKITSFACSLLIKACAIAVGAVIGLTLSSIALAYIHPVHLVGAVILLVFCLFTWKFYNDNVEHKIFRKLINPLFILKCVPYILITMVYTSFLGSVTVFFSYLISDFLQKAHLFVEGHFFLRLGGILPLFFDFIILIVWLLSALTLALVLFQIIRELFYILCRRLISEGKSITFSLK